jgi:diadenosine tetraphosphate (Ap4A) HIT family hydrolase
MSKIKVPRKLSLVGFVSKGFDPEYIKSLPFKEHRVYIFLGEIPNMPGHCVVVEHKNHHQIFSGYHTDNFVELTEGEV